MHLNYQHEVLDLWSRLAAGWVDHLDPSGARLIIDGVRNQHDAGGSYEGVTRMLWGLGGWLSHPDRNPVVTWRGREYDLAAATMTAVVNGTDPRSAGFWGWPTRVGNDLRTVESGQVAYALWQSRETTWDQLDGKQRDQIVNWLDACGVRPSGWYSNWALFWALNHRVRDALGVRCDPSLVESVFDYLDDVYCGDGWYDDGSARGTNQFDDYNLWVFASHVLALADIDLAGAGSRLEGLLERVRLQMAHVPYAFAADGAYAEYGRSLAYGFARLGAMVGAYRLGFWPHSVGLLRRIVGRHLRWYVDNGKVRADGTLAQSLTADGSTAIREGYISTGAPYWAMQAFGALWALADDDPFWDADEEPLPVERGDFVHVMPEPGFVLVGSHDSGHVQRFTARSHHKAPAMYGKFVYSTSAAFNVGLRDGLPLPDSMICLVDGDDWGHRDTIDQSAVGPGGWLRFRHRQRVQGREHIIETVIVPYGRAHVRVHFVTIDGDEPVRIVEGAAPLGFSDGVRPSCGVDGAASIAQQGGRVVGIRAVLGPYRPHRATAFGAPSAHSRAGNHVTPWLEVEHALGSMQLVCEAWEADEPAPSAWPAVEVTHRSDGTVEVRRGDARPVLVPPL